MIGIARGFSPFVLSRRARPPSGSESGFLKTMPPHPDQLQAAAAEVAHDPRRLQEPCLNAGRGELCFLGVADDLDRNSASFLSESEELGSILSPADGRRREGMQVALFDAADSGELREPGERRKRKRNRLFVQAARGIEVAAEPAHRLFLEQWRRRARQALVNDEADGVRADVDDCDRLCGPAAGPCAQ